MPFLPGEFQHHTLRLSWHYLSNDTLTLPKQNQVILLKKAPLLSILQYYCSLPPIPTKLKA